MRKTRLTLGLAAVAAFAAVAGPAQADTQTSVTNVTLNAGALQFVTKASASDFAAFQLTGATSYLNTAISNWAVSDSTGTGKGWDVNFTASQFTNTTNNTVKLPTSSLKYTVPSLVTPADPLNVLQAPTLVVAPSGLTLDAAGGATVASAAAGKGAGQWNYTQANTGLTLQPPTAGTGDLQLTVPAGALAGTYQSTITETLSPKP